MKSKKLFLFFLMISFAFTVMVHAETVSQDQISSVISAFRSYKNIDALVIKVPTVVEVSFSEGVTERLDFAVLDVTTNSFEPYFLKQDKSTQSRAHVIRFLAQPSHQYHIYFDSDRQVAPPVGEVGNLASAKDFFTIPTALSQNNSNFAYRIADSDKDAVPDVQDNCILVANQDQKDINTNGIGDVCDDFDQDGVINTKDNCVNNPNHTQLDVDSDGIGDVCDGQESRITERYTWIPWVGIGFAVFVLIVLFALTARSSRNTIG